MGTISKNKWWAHLLLLSYFVHIGTCFCAEVEHEEPMALYEQKIKAGLVYNFLKYTTWPPHIYASGKLQVCLLGTDAFEGYLSPLEGRTAQQLVIMLSNVSTIRETNTCHLIFIAQTEEAQLRSLLQYLEGKQILTVSDIRQFADKGGMIELATEEQRVNLYVNETAVTHAGLGIQDRLLKLAKLIAN